MSNKTTYVITVEEGEKPVTSIVMGGHKYGRCTKLRPAPGHPDHECNNDDEWRTAKVKLAEGDESEEGTEGSYTIVRVEGTITIPASKSPEEVDAEEVGIVLGLIDAPTAA